MSTVTFGIENYIDPDFYVGMTYSSQQTNFPASNILNYTRRTKVFRTGGYWLITSANKGIVLQTSAGVNQTVNMAEGTYTTDAAFLAAIDTALTSESSGAAFTVTRDTTTNKIKITSDGAGGTLFRLMCTNVAFTAASILGFSTASDLTGALTYTADTLKINTAEWIRWDCGTSVNPKAFALIGERNVAIKISPTATLTLQGNPTDVWTSPSFTQVLTYNEFAMGLFDENGFGANRYWRLLIDDTSNLYTYVELSNIYLGDAFIADQGAAEFPLSQDQTDLSEVSFGRSGTRFVDQIQGLDTFDFNWANLTTSEKEDIEDHVRTVGKKPFFVFLDPNEVFSSQKERNIRYVAIDGSSKARLGSPNNWSIAWSLREEL